MMKQRLATMFPDLSQEVVEAVMAQHGGSEEATIDALLALNDTRAGKHESLKAIIERVERMVDGRTNARQLAGKFGLDVMRVAWEDNGRSKGSCWGPCISDMTLNVLDHALPLVRHPNFEDLTWYLARVLVEAALLLLARRRCAVVVLTLSCCTRAQGRADGEDTAGGG
jgi:hypothetical protein